MNADQKKAVQSLKTARGQMDAIINMIEDGRYCIDVSNQILAVQSLLKKADLLIIKQHLDHCVREAFEKDRGSEKMDEIMQLLSKIMGK